MRVILLILLGGLLGSGWYLFENYSIFVVQPIGAIPDGATFVIPRRHNLMFVDSADALCERLVGNVSLICRGAMLGKVLDVDEVLVRLPYQEWLYEYSNGGKRYER